MSGNLGVAFSALSGTLKPSRILAGMHPASVAFRVLRGCFETAERHLLWLLYGATTGRKRPGKVDLGTAELSSQET
ncbi:hypothetical protein RFN28_31540 [Mesorhizobium sp. VK24D]|uniref:Uncharacterized protein n=1 Tax=Mesorhizobium album TaxID=3072314 RepID=A0ABU4Y7R9_9HYPH|nr:hypothetical protein [Mesorhizobium sp. VK24D]MDX8482958.1 hypothetical protein [Mesorhizobium sp. VK24D]